jgi:membrane-bound lytic murein transglycosylase D
MARHLRNMLCWVFVFGLALGSCASPSQHSWTSNTGQSPGYSQPQRIEPAACEGQAPALIFASAEPPGKDGGEADQEEAASLHPEMQTPRGEAEDVTFLNELEQSGLPQDDSSFLPVVSNERVEAFIELFEGPQKQWMERGLRRSGRYSQRMKQILREEGLPEDLVYLALIESGFNPYAYSSAKAMGIWQFIPGTGRRYGLVINWWIDERRDLEKSARAAAHYLKNLYGLFDDWYLAAAAYNAGEGKLKRAIRKYDSTCFWDLSQYRYLRRETKNYVPKFLAALTIAKDPGRYGFADVEYDAPLLYETVTVPDATDLAVIAKGCGKSLALLNKLNPQLLRGCTPPDYPDYEVKVPLGTKETFLTYYSQLEPAKRLTFRRHRIRKNETLSHIAQQYGISVNSIMAMNRLGSRHSIREGKSLIIPLPASYKVASQKSRARKPVALPDLSGRGYRKVVHVVEQGDSLWLIGHRYGVSVSSLRKWNRKSNSSRIRPGQKIVVWLKGPTPQNAPKMAKAPPAKGQGEEIWYTVKPGDSLWEIAREFDVTVAQLSRWNQIDIHQPIRPGLRLRIYKKILLNADLRTLHPRSLTD